MQRGTSEWKRRTDTLLMLVLRGTHLSRADRRVSKWVRFPPPHYTPAGAKAGAARVVSGFDRRHCIDTLAPAGVETLRKEQE